MSPYDRWQALFKRYDIRGTVPDPLDPAVARAIGRSLAETLGTGPVAVGRDMRLSSPALAAALIQGLTAGGIAVWDLGLCSTDMVTFVTGQYGLAGGVMVTASHNPGNWNGFKCCGPAGVPLSGEQGLDRVRERLLAGSLPPAPAPGRVVARDLLSEYGRHLRSLVDVAALRPLKVVVDAGNGMAGMLFPAVTGSLPLRVVPLFFELDGRFPNHPASPIEPENQAACRRAVRETGADLGLLFDGDADRLFVVDERGEGLSGTVLTALLAEHRLARHPGATVLYNVLCGRIVPEVIARAGGRGVQTPVGHSLIKAIMREEQALFAGEHSGHYYFRENFSADSGLLAALFLLERISQQAEPLSELVAPYQQYAASGEINNPVADRWAPQALIATLRERYADGDVTTLDGLRVDFPHWWFNVRPSNTEPLLRLNVEADSPALLAEKQDELVAMLRGSGKA
jgi:phosphomannomutase